MSKVYNVSSPPRSEIALAPSEKAAPEWAPRGVCADGMSEGLLSMVTGDTNKMVADSCHPSRPLPAPPASQHLGIFTPNSSFSPAPLWRIDQRQHHQALANAHASTAPFCPLVIFSRRRRIRSQRPATSPTPPRTRTRVDARPPPAAPASPDRNVLVVFARPLKWRRRRRWQ